MPVGNAATATGFVASIVVLLGGIALGVWSLRRVLERAPGPSPRTILDERLARGSISLHEYEERRVVLSQQSPSRRSGRGYWIQAVVASVLVAAGLAGSTAFAAAGSRDGWGRMMGPWMMGGSPRSGGRAAEPVPGAPRITVVGDEFSFRPKVARARPDETVNLRFENRGDLFHTLTIADLDFELRADGGETVTGSLRAPASGRFTIVCTVPGHDEAGMHARLVVTSVS